MPISSDELKTKKALKRLLRGLSLQDLKRLQETASELITKQQAQAAAEQAELQRRRSAAAKIREQLEAEKLTIEDLMNTGRETAKPRRIRRQKRYAAIVEGVRMEYGGSGRKPDWLVKLLSEGHDLSEFLITSSDQGAQASAS